MRTAICVTICLPFVFFSCSRSKAPAVNPLFADSLLTSYQLPEKALVTGRNLLFWEKRMAEQPDDFVNGPKLASALLSDFQLYGNIHSLASADSLLLRADLANQLKEPGLIRSRASLSMMRHRFAEADSFLRRAVAIDGDNIANHSLSFDIAFERGNYAKATQLLQNIQQNRTYGYLFRRAKLEHYHGSLDTAISCMLQAAEKAGNNVFLRETALSNAADLYMHKGDAKHAARLYQECTGINPAGFHHISGLGQVALLYDHNDSLAEKLFRLVEHYTTSPDILLKLEQVAEKRNDTAAQIKYASQFVQQAGDSLYGLMYSKYLVDIYTGVLQSPQKAIAIAEQELSNRPTPQIYAWYAWSLYCNGDKEKAYAVFKSFVSQMPLEGPELYYMGCMMKGLKKGYTASQFFKAAWKNRFDLSPQKIAFLKEQL